MMWLRHSATYWRKRAQYARHCAEYARECAESARSDRSKQKYLKIAKKYDQEADRAGERLKKRASTVSDVTDLGADMPGAGAGSQVWRQGAGYARGGAHSTA